MSSRAMPSPTGGEITAHIEPRSVAGKLRHEHGGSWFVLIIFARVPKPMVPLSQRFDRVREMH